eukprot:6230606-Pyramimonas_sp.AAC.1
MQRRAAFLRAAACRYSASPLMPASGKSMCSSAVALALSGVCSSMARAARRGRLPSSSSKTRQAH